MYVHLQIPVTEQLASSQLVDNLSNCVKSGEGGDTNSLPFTEPGVLVLPGKAKLKKYSLSTRFPRTELGLP
jgi:hypothetical protein